MASYNVEAYIEASIRSALAQENVALEILVADDASSDRTAEIVGALAHRDSRIRLLRQSCNNGPSAARNSAIAQAKGTWLAILDADDIIQPHRMRQLLDLAEMVEADIVADNLLRFDDATGQVISTAFATGPAQYTFAITPGEYLLSNVPLGRGFGFGYLKPVIRTSFLQQHCLLYNEGVQIGEDFLFCLDALFHGARYFVHSEPLYHYRVRSGSQSHRMSRAHIEQLAGGFKDLIRQAKTSDVQTEVDAYRKGLGRAREFVTVIEELQGHDYGTAIQMAAVRPYIWTLIGRYGVEFALKRLNRLAARPSR